ncbi:DUF4238 domain-containing protein [Tepidibacter sp. Z1-5]|uniref:DUF4238 domain-containing protein n=1 Tax=Tepidibacter sp. Z1-5 TaxID=3134138 RepID=UPI0030C4EBF5
MKGKIEKKNQITVDQHYVPRFYMKNFSIIKGTGKKEKALISFYQFDEGLLKDKIPTKSICYKEYFYGEDGEIEKDFSEKEKKWAKTIRSIIETDKYNLTEGQEKAIKQFAIFQYCRTLAMYNYSKDTMSEILLESMNNMIPDVKEEIARKLVNKKIEDEIHVADIIEVCDELVQVIDDLDVSIIKFNTTKKLITSDMPVVIMNPFCSNKAGFANVGVVILFPVSPEVMVVIYDRKIYNNCNPYMVISDEQEVINLNKYQVINAEERILSKEQEELAWISSDSELILKREEYRLKRKVDSSFDGQGTFIATKSRSMHYEFGLSFCKLPKYLMKIPTNCREAFERQYSYEARINLLVRVYRFPELINQNKDIPQVKISKMKDGYSEMQKFMDGYWNIEAKNRIITPELIRELKTLHMTYFPIDKK